MSIYFLCMNLPKKKLILNEWSLHYLILISIMTNNNNQSKAGTGAVGVVQIVFIILKLTKTGTISNWPWWMVMLPFICTLGLACCCSLTACCCGIICAPYLSHHEKKKNIVNVWVLETFLHVSGQIIILQFPTSSWNTVNSSHVVRLFQLRRQVLRTMGLKWA